MVLRRGAVGEVEAVSADLTLFSSDGADRRTTHSASPHSLLNMPRKAAPKLTEAGDPAEAQAPRRSTRISSQPKLAEEPAQPTKKPATPRKKRTADEADTQHEAVQEDSAKKVGIFQLNISRALVFSVVV